MSDVTAGSPPVPPPPSGPAADVLTHSMLESLRKTKPWVRLVSIMGFIAAALMIVGSLVMIGVGVVGVATSGAESAMVVGMAVLYLLFGVLYVFPSLYLFRYASAIGSALSASPRTFAVEQALRWQKSFWKFAGILTLVMLLLYIPGIIAAIAIPNFLTASQRSKQKRTMADIRSIATAAEARAVDYNQYPPGRSIEELAPLVEPTYIRSLPRQDGWGNPFLYEATDCTNGTACQGYIVASGGKDGSLEMDALEDYVAAGPETIENFNDAIVYANGSFLRYPAGPAVR